MPPAWCTRGASASYGAGFARPSPCKSTQFAGGGTDTGRRARTFLADGSPFACRAAAGELFAVILAGAAVQAGVRVAGPRGFLRGGGLAGGLSPGGGREGGGGSLGADGSCRLGAGSSHGARA